MVMTGRALHEAAQRLLDAQGTVVLGLAPEATPLVGTPGQVLMVPWRDGVNVSGTDQWGFTWYSYDCNFRGINETGQYLIENNCDAYLLLGDQTIKPERLP